MIFLNKYSNYIFAILLCLLLLIGLNSFEIYGISWDEGFVREIGNATLVYIANFLNINPFEKEFGNLLTHPDRHYGPAFTALLSVYIFVNQHFFSRLTDSQDIYFFTHIATHLFFLTSLIAMYCMAKLRFKNYLALIAILFLVLSPRIYANSFYNIKDIPFLASYLIAAYFSLIFIIYPTKKNALFSAFFSAYAIDIRLPALIIPMLTIIFFLLRVYKKELNKNSYFNLFMYLFLLPVFIIIMWPYLWENPLINFIEAYKRMSNHEWSGSTFFMGNFASGSNVPWHFSLTWIGITTPILYLSLFAFGCYKTLTMIFSNRLKLWKNNNELMDYFFICLLFFPIFSVIVLKSTLYDGWRHLYFIYPFLIIISIQGLDKIIVNRNKIFKFLAYFLIIVNLLWVLKWMYKYYPFGNVFFNNFVNEKVHQKFESDYWGLSNKMALNYILRNDGRKHLSVSAVSCTNLDITLAILDENQRNRLTVYDFDDEVEDKFKSDYLINNFRCLEPGNKILKSLENYERVFSVKTDKLTIVEIYKNNQHY